MIENKLDWNYIKKNIQSSILNREIIQSINIKKTKQISKRINQLKDISPIWNGLLDKVEWLEQTPQKLNPQERSLWKLIAILYYTEGPLNIIINYIIYSLIIKGKKIKIRREKRFADSFDDIYKIPLVDRLDFLKKNDFDFMSKIPPRDIRNAIAHQYLIKKIEPDGTVILTTEKKFNPAILDERVRNIVKLIKIFSANLKPFHPQ